MTIKGEDKTYKLQNYQISINPISEKKLQIQVIDIPNKIEFAENQLTLDKIGTSTLILALEATRKELSITANSQKEGSIEILQFIVKIESTFLKTIEQKIYIKKVRDVNQFEIIDKRIKSIGQKLKSMKEKGHNQSVTFYSFAEQEQSFFGAGYETVASIKLKKGKYLLTFSFLLKATNQWLYLYLNNENFITNGGYYVPTTGYYIPFTIRVVRNIEEDKEIRFQTNCASSYPVSMKNRIITAQKISE